MASLNRVKHIAGLLALVALVACSHGTGHVRIGMVYSGGPNPAALTHRWEPGVVRVYRPDGSFVTSRHIQEGETLSTDLSPGMYRVVGHSGDAGCKPKTVTVRGGESVVVRIVCQIR